MEVSVFHSKIYLTKTITGMLESLIQRLEEIACMSYTGSQPTSEKIRPMENPKRRT